LELKQAEFAIHPQRLEDIVGRSELENACQSIDEPLSETTRLLKSLAGVLQVNLNAGLAD
jgi:hypothetical protein